MIELYELKGEDYGDRVDVVRCEDCIWRDGIESSRYVKCLKHYSIVPKNGYCYLGEKDITKGRTK